VLTAPRADRDPGTATDPFDSVFSSIDFTGGALVAISGGGDSTALLLLLKQYLDRNAPATQLLAVTVDHDLRSDSAAEAEAVARLCADLGIAHRTLLWTGTKPSTGLPAAAREARYRLLAKAAKDAGIGMILTGHTADDQAETVLMRQMRTDEGAGQHGRGLAGMAPATLYDWQTWIVRPLLGTRREALREFLRRQGADWVDDPTNADEAFERPRIRKGLDAHRNPQHFAEIIATAKCQAAAREATSRRAAALVRSFASQPAAGLIRLDPAFAVGDRDAAIAALRVLLATVGGVAFPPDEARTAALIDNITDAPFCATLSRSVIDARRTGIFLRRELRDLPEAATAVDGMVWDGRRRINFHDEAGSLLIEPLGSKAAAKRPVPENGVPASLVRAASAAEPAFRHAPEQSAASSGNPPEGMAMPMISPFARFLPSFDLRLAEVVADLVGAPVLPASPVGSFRAGKQSGKA
jgi:tRNA(Ile)-lysidine synthase